MRKKALQQAQSVLEYLVILSAIIALLLWAGGTIFRPAMGTILENSNTTLSNVADKM